MKMWKFQLSLICMGLIFATSKADHEDGHHEAHGRLQGGNIDPFQEYYAKCNNGTCVGSPKDCYKTKDCAYMVLILKDDKTNKFNFTLFGPIEQSGYVAVGISHSGKQMVNTSITECISNSNSPNNNLIRSSWTYKVGKPQVFQGDDNGSGLPISYDTKPYQFNGKLICSFQHNHLSTIHGHIFDLNKDLFHILIAVGKLDGDSTTLKYHENGRFISSDYLSLSSSAKALFGTPLILSTLLFVIAKIL